MSQNTTSIETTEFSVAAATAVMLAFARELRETDEFILEDERAFLDTIEGQCDFFEIIDAAVSSVETLSDYQSAIADRIAILSGRKARLGVRAERMRAAILAATQALGQGNLKRPSYTAIVNKPRTSVEITDVEELPQGFFRTVKTADKAAIKTALEAKAEVPGATLVTGEPSLTLRVK